METSEKEGIEDGDSPRAKRTREVPPRSDFSRAPWSIMLRKAELKRCDSREYRNFRRHFRIPYEFFLELVQLAKYQKWFSLAARDVAGRQCIPVELKVSSSVANSAWYMGWIRDLLYRQYTSALVYTTAL